MNAHYLWLNMFTASTLSNFNSYYNETQHKYSLTFITGTVHLNSLRAHVSTRAHELMSNITY